MTVKSKPLRYAFDARLRSPSPQRSSRRRSDLRCTAIRVYDEAGNVVEAGEHAGEFTEP
jgi:hypothetical protein